MATIKTLFFDFGGCIDGDGVHTRTQYREAFMRSGSLQGRRVDELQEAYSIADQTILKDHLALGLNLLQFNTLMVKLITDELRIFDADYRSRAAQTVTEIQKTSLQLNVPVIRALAQQFTLSVVSNFTGNLEVILKEFGIFDCFKCVGDSFHVGFTKPDIRLFQHVIGATGADPKTSAFIGDNIERDLRPARSLGLKTVYVNAARALAPEADAVIANLRELPQVCQTWVSA